MDHVVATWRKRLGTTPNFAFLDERINVLYDRDERLSTLFTVFSALALLIACLGLLGLASFSAERRTKEIGIRKTLGATTSQIVQLLFSDFGRLVLIGQVLNRRGDRTPLGEVLMVQGHDSYHLGQIVQLREQLGSWPPPKGGDTW